MAKWNLLRVGILFSLFALISFIAQDLSNQQAIGMQLILKLQSNRSAMLDLFMYISSMWGFEFIFCIVPYFVWSGERNKQEIGLNIVSIIYYSFVCCSIIKIIYQEPRPLWIEKSIHREEEMVEFSFPSGHAWMTTIFWLTIMSYLGGIKQKYFIYMFGIGIILLTSFSRVYFGLHYPHDVVAGISCGAIMFLFRDYILPYNVKRFNLNVEDEFADSQRYNKNYPYIQGSIAFVAFVLVNVYFEEVHLKQQLGLFFAFGGIITTIILGPSSYFLEDNNGIKNRLLRVVLGMLPILLIGIAYKIFVKNMHAGHNNHQSSASFMFCCGIFKSIWVTWGSQVFFNKIKMGSIVLKNEFTSTPSSPTPVLKTKLK